MRICLVALTMLCSFVIRAQAAPAGSIQEMLTSCHDYLTQPDEKRDLGEDNARLIVAVCRNPVLFSRMNPADQRSLLELARGTGQSDPAQDRATEDYAAMLVETLRNDACPRSDDTRTDAEIRRLWGSVRDALKRNDLETALGYFFQEDRDKYRQVFTKIASRELRALTQENNEISVESITDQEASYHIFAVEEGQIYDYRLHLRRDVECNWKIISF